MGSYCLLDEGGSRNIQLKQNPKSQQLLHINYFLIMSYVFQGKLFQQVKHCHFSLVTKKKHIKFLFAPLIKILIIILRALEGLISMIRCKDQYWLTRLNRIFSH